MEAQRAIIQPLNGARGLAAAIVALFHFRLLLGVQLAPGGYLAVDFFFILSGFVVANAYDRRFAAGLSPLRFLWLRVRRFYPLYALGVLITAAWLALQAIASPPAVMTPATLAAGLALALLFLPHPVRSRELFPLNGPAWSLFLELLVNAAYGALSARIGTRGLLLIAGASAPLLVAGVIANGGANVGHDLATAWAGPPRASFSFAVGALIYRLRDRLPASPLGAVPLLLLLGAAMVVPVPRGRALFDLVAILALFPAAVALLSTSRSSPRLDRLFARAGDMSFPLYAIHFPVLAAGLFVEERLPLPGPVFGVLLLLATMAASLALHRWFDRPLQERLRGSDGAGPSRHGP